MSFRVLIAEDSAAVRAKIRLVLSSLKECEVLEAEDGIVGLARLGEGRIDLVICDLVMPQLDGFGFLKAMKADPQHWDLPVIILTGAGGTEAMVQGLAGGASDYVSKPFEPQELLARVKVQLKLKGLQDDLKAKNRTLEEMVRRDSLTGLYNHAFLQEYVEQEMLRAKRHRREIGLLLVDIDDFKQVNDTLGHPVGDQLVKAFAEVLSATTRRTDVQVRLGPEDRRGEALAARYGGDEFAVVLPETGKMGAIATAERLRSYVAGHEFRERGLPRVTCSVGVASFPADAPDRASLVSAADVALYAAKHAGKNLMVAYSPALAMAAGHPVREVEELAGQRAALERSIANKSFWFAYQPIVKADYSVFAYEALCRPTDPTFPTPSALFHVAERAGRVADLGGVLRDLAVAPIDDLPQPRLLFVNLHPLELSERLLDEEAILTRSAGRVVLEVTEADALRDFDRLKALFGRAKERGFRIAVDDLGAGYASLNSLAHLEPDFVKLDMVLLRGIQAGTRPARLIRSIVTFANGEGIQVVAEGIETREEKTVATELGVHLLQGFYFARPAPPFVEVERKD